MSGEKAVFLSGSILRHVIVMTLTGAIGLMTMFVADLADLYYLSLLKNTAVTAAIGFAGVLAFANLSMSLGIGIAAAALVARNLGAGQPDRARDFATSSLSFTLLVSTAYTLMVAIFAPQILQFLGATGEALTLGTSYIRTLTPGFIMFACAVTCAFCLRGLGDSIRAMLVTLLSAIVTLILDPIFIFTFNWGIQGAALAHVVANATALAIGLWGLVGQHRFLKPMKFSGLKRDFPAICTIALPAMLTQLATPFTVAYTTYITAPYGAEAVAGSAIVGRVVPVAFGIIFALSGAVGPIIGQNFGAGNFARVRQALWDGLKFAAVYTMITAGLLFLFRHPIADAFHAAGDTRRVILFFCTWIGVTWAFAGAQFVANAAFNNLGRPKLSTLYNWGKATLGTVPFALIGGSMAGLEGIMTGMGLGSVVFGVVSVIAAARLVSQIQNSPSASVIPTKIGGP